MVVADDDVREWGKQNWAEKSEEYIGKGYVPISMKNDFVVIYAEGITRAEEQYREQDWTFDSWNEGIDKEAA